ncbi:hypothetical protein HN512_02980 [Candidatus Peregrinibacteria bacterium]|jgi:hypothetical protein|nr:hypothetical protein [Candidatus Peregrinibacteria bacterium]MBT3598776.1 hypothetical protein [Candidatus Peregrinibacteria bacterium]MBT4367556.1 hypothetical protein [Candidatus Peregrinibacteria bacterium]MBT4585844.1 hypothetical protein [Candidatus Peregrinibacteria bacterium]MBT6731214.1 hypothetical protein [Candidatus Peregrinibacteria bacterium]
MPNIFSIIGEAWNFYQKQPVLNSVLLWMILLPLVVISFLGIPLETIAESLVESTSTNVQRDILLMILLVFLNIVFGIITIWGTACTLLIGKKLLKNSSGRTRSSFKTLRTEAAKYVPSLVLTGILRGCLILLWSLLLVIPGIIYGIRTSFYSVTLVCEGKKYRNSLSASTKVVKGNTFSIFLYLVGISLVIFIPINIITGSIRAIIEHFDDRLIPAFSILEVGANGVASMIVALSTIILFSHVKKLSKKPTHQSVSAPSI